MALEDLDSAEILPKTPDKIRIHLEEGRARQLSEERFPYHNWEGHILVAYEDVKKLGELMGLTDKEIGLVQIAALYHDIAMPEGEEGHEKRSADIAEEDLKGFGFSDEDISVVKKIIRGTEGQKKEGTYITQPSKDPLVLIMRDADSANVGKENYFELVEALRKERGIENKRGWLEFQLKFLTKHKFNTAEAEKLWGEQKKKNLEHLQLKL